MSHRVLFIGPVAEKGGPAIKNRIMTEYFRRFADLRIHNTYDKSAAARLGAIREILFAKEEYMIVAVSRKGRNLLYPFLYLRNKLRKTQYCCVVIGGNVLNSFRVKTAIRAMREADLVTVETKGLKKGMEDTFGLNNVSLVPNYKEGIARRSSGNHEKEFHHDPLRFLFLSSMRNAKGVRTLLKAFRQVIAEGLPAQLDYYGPLRDDLDPDFLAELEKETDIRYLGEVKNDQVLPTMESYDVFVFPTEYTGEGFPAVLVEAMSAGLPVISSDMNDNPQIIVHGKNGWIYPHGDADSLAQCIRACIQDREALERVSSENRKEALQYDADGVLERFRQELKNRGWPV